MPYPPKDGGSIVTLNYAKEFARLGCDVTILAMNTYKRSFDVEKIPSELREMIKFYAVDVDTRIRPLYLFVNLFQDVSYHIWRYGSSEEFKNLLTQILQSNDFNIVQLEGLYLAPYLEVIRRSSKAKVILRSHNVEYEIIERYAEWEKSNLKRYWLQIQAERLKKYELAILNKFDGVVAITERDADIFRESGCKVPIYVAPAGIEMENYKPDFKNVDFNSLFFIGALDWFPNQQGLEWFLKNVWIEIYKKFPSLKFYIAGRNPQLWKFSTKVKNFPNVELVGEVEDAREFMRSKGIMVVPIFSGSGIRVKIIEAIATGKIVITTSIGMEGIEPNRNILIAKDASDFIIKLSNCLSEQKLLSESKEVNDSFRKRYDISSLAMTLLKFYEQILKKQ